MTVFQIIRTISTEFSEVDDSVLESWIQLCTPWVSKKLFGVFYEQAIAFLVCHKLKMTGYGDGAFGAMGSIGNIFTMNSISDGGTSISFGGGGQNVLSTDGEFSLTVYGAQFLQLRRMVIVPVRISGEDTNVCY